MNLGLFEIVLDRVTSSELSPEAVNLVMASCQGAEALKNLLNDGQPPDLSVAAASLGRIPGVFLGSLTVQGFRGIGASTKLPLHPGPGLTLVVGRNGSGKSSLAEGLELLLTGHSARWDERSQIWRSAWRNLHEKVKPKIQAELVYQEGRRITCTREWSDDAAMEGSQLSLQPVNSLEELGWKSALEDYRPFLSHNELGDLLTREPSKLYDALWKILGLGALTDALDRLAQLRKQDEASVKTLKAEIGNLKARLGTLEDDRAKRCLKELSRKSPDWAKLRELSCSQTQAAEGEVAQMRRLVAATFPSAAEIESKSVRLEGLLQRQESLRSSEAARSHSLAELLQAALVYQQESATQDCPVCKSPARLGAHWMKATRVELQSLQEQAREAKELEGERRQCEQDCRQLFLSECPHPQLAEVWEGWQAGRQLAGSSLVDHLRNPRTNDARAQLACLADSARQQLDQLEAEWMPLAQLLATLAGQAEQNKLVEDRAKRVKVAEEWLKEVSDQIRFSRFEPISKGMSGFWAMMRQESNVELIKVVLTGQKTSRRVEVEVKVDDASNVALGVMSQGELNSLALSLFLPRATQTESPFRFLCIDDPVQAMDPAKVDGLARVLEQVAKTHQVLVFTHDNRLFEAVLRLGIQADVLEVTRRAGSAVELRRAHDPIKRALLDARALVNTPQVPDKIGRKVIPSFCRRALEICLTDICRRRQAFRMEEYDRAETLNKKASLALFGTLDRVGDVANHLRRYGTSAQAYHDCNKGSHGNYVGDLGALIDRTEDLVGRMRTES